MPRTVLDAGPLIHLDQLGCLDLLEGLEELHVPLIVWREVLVHRPTLGLAGLGLTLSPLSHPSRAPSPALAVLIHGLDLDAGEIAALTLMEEWRGDLFLSDDAAARLAAESLGFRVHGTVGLVIRALRRGTRTIAQVRSTLEQIPTRSTLHINRSLLDRVIASLPAS